MRQRWSIENHFRIRTSAAIDRCRADQNTHLAAEIGQSGWMAQPADRHAPRGVDTVVTGAIETGIVERVGRCDEIETALGCQPHHAILIAGAACPGGRCEDRGKRKSAKERCLL